MMEASMEANRSLQFARVFLAVAALGCGPCSVGTVAAEPYPNRPIKLVVPFAAGGPGDIIARAIGDKLSASLKQPFVIENRPGAGGNVGTEVLAKAAPDGHTLGIVLNSILTVNPSVYRTLPFDPDKDFRPISIVSESGMMLVVHPSVPVNSVREFVAYAKAAAARKEPLIYASGGNGGPGHLTMENFRLHAGFEAMHVPYRSNAPMVVDLVGGQVKVAFVTSSGMMDHVLAGKLKGLGVSRVTRSPLAPDVPTIDESGYPGFRVESYQVLLAPAGLPEPIAARLAREVQAALKFPDVIERLRAMDVIPSGIIGPEVHSRLKADRAEWANVIAAANMRLH
jgi:tripartite-type tricarboxylate transporter receptor subunit TctC